MFFFGESLYTRIYACKQTDADIRDRIPTYIIYYSVIVHIYMYYSMRIYTQQVYYVHTYLNNLWFACTTCVLVPTSLSP